MSKWVESTLGEVVELKRGYDLPERLRHPGTFPIVSSSGISGTHSEAKVRGPGVVTGRYGTIGKVYWIDEDYWPLNTTLYVQDFKGNDPQFISYFLGTIDFLSCSDKAAVPGVNRNHLHQVHVTCPPLDEQKAIAHILGSLDDKIELNRRLNDTLEAMARALFKSWFIDFDPVRARADGETPKGMDKLTAVLFPDSFQNTEHGPIPREWKVRALYDCATYINGSAFRNDVFSPDKLGLPIIKIAELKDGITSQTKFTEATLEPKYRINSGDILFSWSGSPDTSIDTFVWTGGPGWLNQHIFKLEFPRLLDKLFVHYLLRHLKPVFIEIARNKQTTGLGHVTGQDLKRLKAVFPPDDVLRAFNHLAEPLFRTAYNNSCESRTLVSLRDTLLPKILSGELRIKDAERFVEAAL